MSRPGAYESPIIDRILHPSNFSEASEVAFAHALKAALVAGSRLTLFHVSPDMTAEWSDFPAVRQTLERWGLLHPAARDRPCQPSESTFARSSRTNATQCPLCSATSRRSRPISSCSLPTGTTMPRTGFEVGGHAVARKAGQATLFVPHGVGGFVALRDGVSLQRILIPVAAAPKRAALTATARMVAVFPVRRECSPCCTSERRGICRL